MPACSIARLFRARIFVLSLASIFSIALLTVYLTVFYLGPPVLVLRAENIHPSRNETLGFGAIYVLTDDDTTWRVQGLRQAAQFIDLRLTIPVQDHPSYEDVQAYLDEHTRTASPNDIRAMINYISLLDTFVLSDYETALFFEDDVDFDVNIKSQMELISRELHSHKSGPKKPNRGDREDEETNLDPETIDYPYGKESWDIFWIGYYGVEYTKGSQIIPYNDPNALPWDHLTSNYNNYYEMLRPAVGEAARLQPQQIMLGAAPIGTYAFALTRETAKKVVSKLREQRLQQFDKALHDDCKDLILKCVAPVPTLMHHHRVVPEQTEEDPETNLAWWRNRHKYTYNVQWSARCNAAGVGEKLGKKWQCLPGRYDFNQ